MTTQARPTPVSHFWRGLAVFSVLALVMAAFWGPAPAMASNHEGGDKVLICHATGSDDNPYNLIEVSGDAWDDEEGTGHADHEDDFLAPEGATDDADCVAPSDGDGEGDGDGEADKVLICHATESDENPYNLIEVSGNAWEDEEGTAHAGHDDDFLAPEGAETDEDCVEDGDGNGEGDGDGDGEGEGPLPPTDTAQRGSDMGSNPLGLALALLTGLILTAVALPLRRRASATDS